MIEAIATVSVSAVFLLGFTPVIVELGLSVMRCWAGWQLQRARAAQARQAEAHSALAGED